jgi:hypothetical protein
MRNGGGAGVLPGLLGWGTWDPTPRGFDFRANQAYTIRSSSQSSTIPMNTETTPTSTIHVHPARRKDFRPIAALIDEQNKTPAWPNVPRNRSPSPIPVPLSRVGIPDR